MSLFIRIYYGGNHKDISLNNINSYTIGSAESDDYRISSADLSEKHIKIYNESNQLKIQCSGEVYLNGAHKVTENVLEHSQIYILSKKHRISMLIINEYNHAPVEIEMDSNSTITIGRGTDNNIVLKSLIVSGEHAVIVKKGSQYYVQDRKSMNGTYLNNQNVTESILKSGDEIVIGENKFVVKDNSLLIYGDIDKLNIAKNNGLNDSRENKSVFKRSPRLRLEVPTGNIEIQSPPNIGTKPELDKISMFLPLMVTAALAIVMAVLFSPMMAIYTLPMQCISGFMSYRNYKKQTKQYDEKEGIRLKKYTDHLEQVAEEIEEKRQQQLTALNQSDPDTNECFSIVKKQARRLWERRPSDSDFMNVRVGSGEIDFSMGIQIPKSGLSLEEDELRNRPQEIYNKYNRVSNAPITCSMLEYPICGIVGRPDETSKLINNMVTQIATHHCYTELRIVSVYDKMTSEELDWIKNLPHSHSDESGQLLISKTKMEAEACFKAFDELFKKRRTSLSSDDSYGKKSMQLPYYLFVITAPSYLSKNNPMNDHLFRSKNMGLGIGVIFAVEDIVQLPPECEMIIELNGTIGQLYNKNTASTKQTFVIDSTTQSSFEEFGKRIKPIFCEDTNTKNIVPTKYSFFEMLGIKSATELNMGRRWETSDIRNRVAAPLGIYGQNELLYLDLHESAHGSHGLVAGKTGSGKSEVLLSYLVAMASMYHPYEVQFVIIDFKGGGMSDRLKNLPHLNTSITNIDGSVDGKIDEKYINRSLISINAEIVRRQRILSEASAKDIGDYIDKYKNGSVKNPLPHLIIVVDEFAELKQSYPEFMKDLVSASRIGRSLGVHLILATQSPAGVVDDQIWNNSNFKLSLMVLDENNSNAVLKSPVAAHISDPGRGYLKVGNGELFELFQSGYSGGKIVDESGKQITQLDAVINCINKYCVDNAIKKLPSICMPALPRKLTYENAKYDGNALSIGLFDDPKGQRQGNCEVDIFNENTMIIGSQKSGKTNLIQSIIRALSSSYSPKDVSIYILDFSSKILKNFETLNHVGGVVTSSEDEKLKNLFKLLTNEIELRKEKQLAAGVSSFAAYKQAGNTDLAQIVVIIDNLTALKEMYFQDDDDLLALCSEGPTYGITFVIGNSQTSGIGYKYLTYFANRIALYCNDSSEYMSLFEHCRERLDDIPGRALIDVNKSFYECQTYLAFNSELEHERAKEIKEYITLINSINGDVFAKRIPSVPEIIKATDHIEILQNVKNKNFAVSLGIDYTTVEPLVIELNGLGLIGVSGKEVSGKHNFIKYLVNTLDRVYEDKSNVHIIDSISRKLAEIKDCKNVRSYEILSENGKKSIKEIEQELESRYSQLASGDSEVLEKSKLIVLVINSIDMLDELCADIETTNSLRNITGKYKNMNVVVIIGGYENKTIPYGANEFVKKIKEDKHIMYFDNISNLKVFDIPLAITRQFKKPIELGDGYYIRDNEYYKVKTVLNWE